MDYSLHPLGDNGAMIEIGNEINEHIHEKVKAISAYLNEHLPKGFIEFIPAFTTITIFYDPFYFTDFRKIHSLPFERVFP